MSFLNYLPGVQPCISAIRHLAVKQFLCKWLQIKIGMIGKTVVTIKRNEPKPPKTSPSHTKPPETSRNQSSPLKPADTIPSPFESSGSKFLPTRNQSSSSYYHALRAFVKVIPILYNSRVFFWPMHSAFFTNRRRCEFADCSSFGLFT